MIGFRGLMQPEASALSPSLPERPSEFHGHQTTDWPRQAWRVLSDQRRLIAGVTAIGTGLLALLVFAAGRDRVYQARAQLLVEQEAWKPLDYPSPGDGAVSGAEASYYSTQFRILRSRSLARRTLTTLALPPASPSSPDHGVPAAPGGRATPLKKGPVAAPPEAIATAEIDAFLTALTVLQSPESRVIELRFKASDPEYSARALNAHLDSYIAQSLDSSRSVSQQATAWLRRRIEEQRQRIDKREAALHQFERRTGVGEHQQAMANQRMSELTSALMRARAQRIARESAFQPLDQARRDGRPLTDLAALVPTSVVQQLTIEMATLQSREQEMAGHYGERHPERIKTRDAITFVDRRLRTEVTNAVDAMAHEVDALRLEERRMAGALASQNAESASAGRRVVEHEAMRRDLVNDRAMLERLQQRVSELTLATEAVMTNIRVLDPAEVPLHPTSDRLWPNIALASAGCFLLALTLAFGRHVLDERVHSPEDLTAHLGLPFLGMVPEAEGVDLGAHLRSGEKCAPAFREAMRDLRTHVLCTPAGQGSRVLLVTSARPDEGKTLVATHLAASLAKVGHRVLLMDLDLRRPALHQVFATPTGPGLAELLMGTVPSRDVFRPTAVKDLWVLTAGRPLSSPGDLLGSAPFKQLMQSLPSSFEHIVIDSPPVMACTDASTIAHHHVGIVFVVGADRTDRRSAQAALDRLEAVGARFVGGVLNRVDLSRNGSAYYPHYDATYTVYQPPQANAAGQGRG
jgi:polysaccharide biosynthesis transport protein